jgi:hypothetical protein
LHSFRQFAWNVDEYRTHINQNNPPPKEKTNIKANIKNKATTTKQTNIILGIKPCQVPSMYF